MFGKLLRILGLNSIQFYIFAAIIAAGASGYGMFIYYKHEAAVNAVVAKQAKEAAATNKAAYEGAMDSMLEYVQIKNKVDADYEKARSEEVSKINALDRKNISADLQAKPAATITAINHGISSLFDSISCSSSSTCKADKNTSSAP